MSQVHCLSTMILDWLDCLLLTEFLLLLAESHAKMWERLTVFGVVPIIIGASYITYVNEQKHHQPPPEYRPYEHMRIRKKVCYVHRHLLWY